MNDEISTVELPEQHVVVVRGRTAHDGIPDFLGPAFSAAAAAAEKAGVPVAGPPFARYRDEDGEWAVEAGFPVDSPVPPGDGVEPSVLPGGHAVQLVHVGSYATLPEAWRVLEEWVIDNGYAPSAVPWETYLDEPGVPQPRTLIVMPCALPVGRSDG